MNHQPHSSAHDVRQTRDQYIVYWLMSSGESDAEALYRDLEELKIRINTSLASIPGAARLITRVDGELGFVRSLVSSDVTTTWDRLQGAHNNYRGIVAEVDAAIEAPQVIELSARFRSDSEEVMIDIDIVAADGLAWIEVKACASDIPSIIQQTQRQLICAAQHPVRWGIPQVVLRVEQPDQELVAALSELGALVWPVGEPPPFGKTCRVGRARLDTTTLCSLVSEVVHCPTDPSSEPGIIEWLSKPSATEQWRLAVEDESTRREHGTPFLDEIEEQLAGRELLTTSECVANLEKILDIAGGPKERARWEEWLRPRLTVVEPRVSDRVQNLRRISEKHKKIFGTADRLEAVALTSNAHLTRQLLAQDQQLEVYVHRPHWLAGL